MIFPFQSSAERLRNKTEKQLDVYSKPTIDFFVLITCSSVIISLGLLLDNAAVIIGGMVVAPLITPFFGFSLYFLLFKWRGMLRALLSIFLGSILAITVAMIVGQLVVLIYNEDIIATTEIISRTRPDLLYFLVALFSGLVGTYAYGRKNQAEKIVGIAISAAVVPPLSVAGLAIAKMNFEIFTQSSYLFLLNLLGIFMGSVLMFLFLGFGRDIEEIKS